MAQGWEAAEEIDAQAGITRRESMRQLEPLTEDVDAYPMTAADVKSDAKGYQDEAAAQLYRSVGGKELSKAHARMTRALTKQAERLETFHSTPFTKDNVKVLEATIAGIEHLQRAMEEWHWLIYPNQKP